MGNRRKLVAMRLGRLAQEAGICWRSKMGSEIGVVECTYIAARYRKQSSNWKGGLSDDSEERHAMGETTLQRMRKQRGSTRRRFGVPALRKAVRVRITQSGVTGHVGGARKRPLKPILLQKTRKDGLPHAKATNQHPSRRCAARHIASGIRSLYGPRCDVLLQGFSAGVAGGEPRSRSIYGRP